MTLIKKLIKLAGAGFLCYWALRGCSAELKANTIKQYSIKKSGFENIIEKELHENQDYNLQYKKSMENGHYNNWEKI